MGFYCDGSKHRGLMLAMLVAMALISGCGGTLAETPLAAGSPAGLSEVRAGVDRQAQVEPQLAAELAAELERVLRLNPPRAVSTPPGTSASATVLSWDEEQGRFQWRFFSAGDYDQNGEVGVSDLTPLGVHFGKSSGGGLFDQSSVESVVDGDSNGLIGVSDVTPIGQNFGIKCQGYRLYYSTEVADVPQSAAEANGAGTQEVTEVPLSEATGTPAERKQFSYVPVEAPLEGYYWVRPYDGQELGTPSNAWLLGALNQAPIAVLRAQPTSGLVPLTVAFQGALSADLDGEIVKYEWDFDGPINGEEWLDTEGSGYAEHTYEEEGAYLAIMRVTDDRGGTDTAAELIAAHVPTPPVAELDFTQESPATPSRVQFDAARSVDDDGIIVRYEWDFDGSGDYAYDSDLEPATTFYYHEPGTYSTSVRVTDDDGLTGASASVEVTVEPGAEWHDVEVPTTDLPTNCTALVEVAGAPAIAYYAQNIENHDQNWLKFTRASDPQGTAWADAVTIQETLYPADSLSMVIAGGRPAIAGNRSNESDVTYVRAEDSAGVSWPEPVSCALFGGGDARLALVDGLPALCASTYFVRALDLAGAAWDQMVKYATGSFAAQYASPALCVVGDRPAISFYANACLAYVRADDAEGQGWGVSILVDEQDTAAGGSLLLVVDGHPAIAWYYPTLGTLKYVRALDAEGSAWDSPRTLALAQGAPLGSILVDGRPAILYLAQSGTFRLRCLIANDPAGASWSFPMQVASLGGREYVTSFALVDGGPAVSTFGGGGGEDRELHYAAYY